VGGDGIGRGRRDWRGWIVRLIVSGGKEEDLGRRGTKFEGFAKGFDVFFFKFFEDGVGEVFSEELDVSEYTRHVGWMV
jgi:hypothetical protein